MTTLVALQCRACGRPSALTPYEACIEQLKANTRPRTPSGGNSTAKHHDFRKPQQGRKK